MNNATKIFKKYQAQTFNNPSCLEVKSATGSYITDTNGRRYLDFIAGVSACTLGHSNPIITKAITEQLMCYRAYQHSDNLEDALKWGINLLPKETGVGMIAIRFDGQIYGTSNTSMPFKIIQD